MIIDGLGDSNQNMLCYCIKLSKNKFNKSFTKISEVMVVHTFNLNSQKEEEMDLCEDIDD